MKKIVESNLQNLQKAKHLLSVLNDEQLADRSIAPYYSSIGSHIRHILDFYNCIFKCKDHTIDLTVRTRDAVVETSCVKALEYYSEIRYQLEHFKLPTHTEVAVIDNLGLGVTTIPYTIGALLAQANSHTIHHYAIINYILNSLGVVMKDDNFGYNPTTPKPVPLN